MARRPLGRTARRPGGGRQVTDYTLYTLGTALLLFKSFRVTGDRGDLALATDIVRVAGTTGCGRGVRRRFLTFISGRAGVCALGAVIAKHCDDQLRVTQYLSFFDEITITEKNSVAKDIIKEGRKLSSKGDSPLMYEWHGKKYWGAAHGLAGIMHVLMHAG
ncbi:hypothetical protein C2845_PM07G35590 [Panicum miliaceum]|uniref:LanC-like protein GCR2 n=1 Tax=Panicum miliaceum TaxID=4540 RepID=A0A3L6SH84_PANMI|nr:hypothetical protein C2845_PM07G35590 [Panicum miliaceum]